MPIYQTNSPEECRYVLENSDAKAVIVEDDEQLEKIREIRDQVPKLEHVILMTGSRRGRDLLRGADRRRGRGRPSPRWEERYTAVTPDDICTFIYTSGTTGPPKGCIISHGNYRAMLDMVVERGALGIEGEGPGEEEISYLFLPLAHSFALLIQLANVELGATIAYWERDPLKIVPNLSEVRPTYFPSVPRIFEKIYTAANAAAEKQGGLKKAVFNWAIGVGRTDARGGALRASSPAGCCASSTSSPTSRCSRRSAPCSAGACGWRPAARRRSTPRSSASSTPPGVLVLEGWGMTETSTAATISTPDDFKIGTIGKPFPGCEVKIADDGEILVKGPNVFQGYYKNEEATRETLVDGWLHTGDIGEVDPDGFLRITGRKKDIIITAGGKNITPANLEAEIKQHPLVSQCVVIGDRRPYLVALVTLDPEEAVAYASEHGLPADPAELAKNPEVRADIEAHVEKINEKFARVEQVKKIAILPADLSQEGGELTPTLKVKRAVVASKYAERDRRALRRL